MPDIILFKSIRDADADLLKKCFSPGVIEVVEQQTNSGETYREARVANARYDSCSRNVFYHEQLKNCVELTRIPDHFICKYHLSVTLHFNSGFPERNPQIDTSYKHYMCIIYSFRFPVTVESVGALPPAVLFVEAIKVLKNKCRTFLAELENVKK